MRAFLAWTAAWVALLPLAAGAESGPVKPRHGIAMHGEAKYGPGFTHFDYANPDAPKGGQVKLAAIGTSFDNLNPYTLKGVAAAGMTWWAVAKLDQLALPTAMKKAARVATRAY